jgi:hypothetical protein
MRLLRIISGVLGGYIVFAFLSVMLFVLTGRDAHQSAPVWFMAATIVAGVCFALLGGMIAAVIAGARVWSLGVTLIIAVGAIVSMFYRPQAASSRWSQVAALLLMAPAAYCGGFLYRKAMKA